MSETGANPYAAVAFDREKLILDHVPLLKHLVGRMSFDLPGSIERDDLYGWGMIGLVQAADSWEPGRGLKFSTYAYTKIRGAILDELRRSDFLPRGRREKVRELDRAVNALLQRNGIAPTPEEIAAELGITLEEVDEILLAARTAGHASLEDDISTPLFERLSDPLCSDPLGSVEWNETKALLVQAIHELTEQERTVITLYYGEELLLREIASVLDLTESRISQIHTRALYRLNRELGARLGGTV